MASELFDIETKNDIKVVIDSFYEKVKADVVLGASFAHVNWALHLPVMYSFWSSLLFETYDYKGNPFVKHQALPIETKHFDRWLALFTQSIEEHFKGERANRLKVHAHQIGQIFQYRMNLIPTNTL